MQSVKEELDEKQLILEFEEAFERGKKEGDNFDFFNDITGLCTLGEFEYRRLNEGTLMSNPAHECTKECNVKPITVFAYRRVRNSGWVSNSELFKARGMSDIENAFGAMSSQRSLHVCFPDMCEHIRPGHYCEEEEGECPHISAYAPCDTRQLKDFWVCGETGNVHICGALCDRKKIITDKECDYVCMLTGQVTERNIVPVEYYANTQLSLAAGNEEPKTAQTGLVNDLTRNGYAKVFATNTNAYNSSVPAWERINDLNLYHTCVATVCTQLLFSETRQMLEAVSYLLAYERAYEDVLKFLRVRKLSENGGDNDEYTTTGRSFITITTPVALSIYQFKTPVSVYFHNVPMLPKVRTYMHYKLRMIDSKYVGMSMGKNVMASVFTQANQQLRVKQTEANIKAEEIQNSKRRLIEETVSRYRQREGITPRRTLEWDSPEWHARMDNIKEIFSHCIVRVWCNINRCFTLYKKTAEDCESMSFKRCLLALLYMTRKTISISEGIVEGNDSGPLVTVIPKIDFAGLLPPENQLEKFSLFPYSNLPMSQKPSSRKLTSTQIEIKKCLYSIGKNGYLNQIQLRMIDVFKEILEKRNNNKNTEKKT